ncbi:MAG: hypothetical protein ACTSPV_16630 [Candidatus Hodarchaeales archaeon]
MVRSSTYRTSKYSAKLVGDVIKNRIDAQRDSMIEQETTQFANIVAVEIACKQYLTAQAIGVMEVPFYMSFVRQCYSITTKHSGDIAHDEICIRHDSWETRGLDSWHMQQLAMDIFTVDISDCT